MIGLKALGKFLLFYTKKPWIKKSILKIEQDEAGGILLLCNTEVEGDLVRRVLGIVVIPYITLKSVLPPIDSRERRLLSPTDMSGILNVPGNDRNSVSETVKTRNIFKEKVMKALHLLDDKWYIVWEVRESIFILR